MKYIRKFDGLNNAKNSTLISPTLLTITENEKTVLAMKNLGTDVEMIISPSSTLENITIVKKTNTFKLSESKLNSGATYA